MYPECTKISGWTFKLTRREHDGGREA